ncbi:MAG: alpha/beta hydrolase [Rhodospirillales bacterium]|nr:alpha/beta hydrolase [Rhodospirillales bacterium]MDE2319874.1 alpha/beta hydrolase [Rhodospirillales bacterium]
MSDRAAMSGLRSVVAPNKGKLRGVAARAVFDDIIGHTPQPKGVGFREDIVGGVPGWWCEPEGVSADRVVLHIHGGWFNWGSAEAFRNLVGHVAQSAAARAFVPNYRLAPEHPFPAAPMDVAACFDGLFERGAKAVAITGDSAGGNLALVLLAQLVAQAKADQVVGAVVLSPVTDLAQTGESWASRADADPFFVQDQAEELIKAYLNGHNPTDLMASPLYGDLTGLPPVRVHVGADEVLLDDSLRYADRAAAAGVDVSVDVWEGMPHGFLGNVGDFDAAGAALIAIGDFLKARFAAGAPAMTSAA